MELDEAYNWILEIEYNLESDVDFEYLKPSLEDINAYSNYCEELIIKKHERERLFKQASYFSHDEIKNYVSKHLRQLFRFQLIGVEYTLISGRIDILAKDNFDNIIGIEIKKKALSKEYGQFKKYNEELQELFGDKAKLIVLSSSFQKKLLELDCSNFELWRYEIWWNRSKGKGKTKYILKNIRVCLYDRDNDFVELFSEEKRKYLREWKKR